MPATDPEKTANALREYEAANEHNRFAILQAQRHNKRLQDTYNRSATPPKINWFPSWPKYQPAWPKF